MTRIIVRRAAALFAALLAVALLAGCYPRYDWRDTRPDCARGFCDFVASFPGKITSVRREVPVGATRLPLSLHVISVGDVTFAVGAFNLQSGGDVAEARATFERKLLDDVGATAGRRGHVTIHTADRTDIAADTFDAEGSRGGQALRVTARFAERRGHLVEVLVIGPVAVLANASGHQAIDTFMTSLRLD